MNLRSDNIIPLNEAIREEIESEIARACVKFGKHHIEVMGIASSWGDTMDDREVLSAQRSRINFRTHHSPGG